MKKLVLLLLLSINAFADIKYAPRQKIVQGTPTITCVGIKYQDMNKFIDAGTCSNMAKQTAEFYKKNSRGLLQMKPKGFQLDVPLNGNPGNYNQAVNLARAKYPNSDYWMVTGNFGTSHAGNKTAYLKGSLYRDAEHETGHLLGLGHAGAYKDENGKTVFDPYGDGESVMSSFPSGFLTAPQYYAEGWLYENEAAIYQPGQTYELRQIANFGDKSSLATVIVPASVFNGGRDAFISFPTGCQSNNGCIALHLAIGNGAGTQRVKIFGDEYYDDQFTGLHIKKLGYANGKITISIDFDKKPGVVLK